MRGGGAVIPREREKSMTLKRVEGGSAGEVIPSGERK